MDSCSKLGADFSLLSHQSVGLYIVHKTDKKLSGVYIPDR